MGAGERSLAVSAGARGGSAGRTGWGRVWGWTRRGLRWRSSVLGLAIVVAIAALAILAPVVAPYDPVKVDIRGRLEGPAVAHPFGTDEFGRDLLSRIVYGGRVSLLVACVAVSILAGVGGLLGLTAGFVGGGYDAVLGRVLDVIYGFPALLLALAIVAIGGPSLTSAMLAIGLHGIPGFARIARAAVLVERESDYVLASRAVGASPARILARHIFPNAVGPMLVAVTLSFGYAILDEAALSFLGLGAQPPRPSWGGMLNDSQSFLTEAPWYSLFPGAVIFLTVLGFNFLGDGLRDALDPRLRRGP